ncbi:MAG TPA: glycine betaine ABC transporter substrate-binding protein, partial [Polyangiaceae bacterium]|nr:glycine betaine ABC transporter substrate-binding protein [Polyangiaceae bacterium]
MTRVLLAVRLVVFSALLVGMTAAGRPAHADDKPRLKIGSKRFTESYILAEIATQVAAAADSNASVTHEQGLGGTAVVFRALEEGSIDVYPEYTGTLAEAVLHTTGARDLASLRAALAPKGIEMTDPLGFDNTYALAVSGPVAARLHLATISDLVGARDLRFGLSPEFLGRGDGYPALAARYGLSPTHVESMDHGLAYEALARGAVDVADAYSTDAKIARYRLTLLTDDRRFFPSYEAVFLYRTDAARRAPRAIEAIRALAGSIDAATIGALNAEAEIDGRTFPSIAQEFSRPRTHGARGDGGDVAGGVAAGQRRETLLPGILSVVRAEGPTHVLLVAIASLLATLVGVPLGVFSRWQPRIGRFVIGATSIAQTIPALALLCFFIPLLGTGTRPALLALFVYGLLPIVRNTVAGLDGIPPALRESAAALGLGPWTQLLRVDLPLASRTILAGI